MTFKNFSIILKPEKTNNSRYSKTIVTHFLNGQIEKFMMTKARRWFKLGGVKRKNGN